MTMFKSRDWVDVDSGAHKAQHHQPQHRLNPATGLMLIPAFTPLRRSGAVGWFKSRDWVDVDSGHNRYEPAGRDLSV